MKAIWKSVIIAESSKVVKLEGYYYFPKSDVQMKFLRNSGNISTCYWKGNAHYFDIIVEGKEICDAAWYYPYPSDAAKAIREHIAFDAPIIITD